MKHGTKLVGVEVSNDERSQVCAVLGGPGFVLGGFRDEGFGRMGECRLALRHAAVDTLRYRRGGLRDSVPRVGEAGKQAARARH